jgi:hypothetical protein
MNNTAVYPESIFTSPCQGEGMGSIPVANPLNVAKYYDKKFSLVDCLTA